MSSSTGFVQSRRQNQDIWFSSSRSRKMQAVLHLQHRRHIGSPRLLPSFCHLLVSPQSHCKLIAKIFGICSPFPPLQMSHSSFSNRIWCTDSIIMHVCGSVSSPPFVALPYKKRHYHRCVLPGMIDTAGISESSLLQYLLIPCLVIDPRSLNPPIVLEWKNQ